MMDAPTTSDPHAVLEQINENEDTFPEPSSSASGISLHKQQRLNDLGACDFIDAVAHRLTDEEREALMRQEIQRLRTFAIGWPHQSYLPGAMMARAGFYYLNDDDKVQCPFCGGVLFDWKPVISPSEKHANIFQNCKFVKGLPCGNIPHKDDVNVMQHEMMSNIKLNQGLLDKIKISPKCSDLGIVTQKASKPEYATEASRKRTFGRFPATCPVPAQKIYEAGFYYTGLNDKVKCFWCEGTLEKWEKGQDPRVEHKRYFPTCQSLLASSDFRQVGRGQSMGRSAQARAQNGISVTSTSLPGPSLSAPEDQSYYAGMTKYCEGLGYKRDDIDKVIRKNNGDPFSSTKEMLEALYALEDQQSPGSPPGSDDGYNAMETAENSVATGEIRCKSCPTGNQPSYIGLPCGCLILCADCAAHKVMRCCPTCEKILLGVMKVYLE